MANEGNKTPADVETDVEVQFTVLGNTDLDRFDELLELIIDEAPLSDAELNEFRDMVVDARRTDGKD